MSDYTPTGSFANCSLNHFRKYVKDGALDAAGVMAAEGLSAAQIPRLEAELMAAGYLTRLSLNQDAGAIASIERPKRRR